MYKKSDSDDAEAITLATINMLDKLLDACQNDAYWSIGQSERQYRESHPAFTESAS